MNPKTKSQKLHEKLNRLSARVWKARDALENALEKARGTPEYEEMCDEMGINPDATLGDWIS